MKRSIHLVLIATLVSCVGCSGASVGQAVDDLMAGDDGGGGGMSQQQGPGGAPELDGSSLTPLDDPNGLLTQDQN